MASDAANVLNADIIWVVRSNLLDIQMMAWNIESIWNVPMESPIKIPNWTYSDCLPVCANSKSERFHCFFWLSSG